MNRLFDRISTHIDTKIREVVDYVNEIADEVTELNEQVSALENVNLSSQSDTCQIVNDVCNKLRNKKRCVCNLLVLGLQEIADPVKVLPDRPRPLKLFLKLVDDANVIFDNRLVFENCNLKLIRDSTVLEHKFVSN